MLQSCIKIYQSVKTASISCMCCYHVCISWENTMDSKIPVTIVNESRHT